MAKFDVAQLQQFFCKAALETYASGQKPIRGADYPWEKKFRIAQVSGELTYLDRYVTNGEWSGGETVILVDNIPVWLMQYHGWTKDDNKAVLDFLKLALKSAYERKKFVGGRGPERFESTNLDYFNQPSGGFAYFMGQEQIKLGDGTVVFWHRYQGMLLGEPE